jgi:polyketide synthase
MKPTAFVTGATGFVGRHLVRALVDAGFSVRALVRPGSKAPNNVDVVRGDLTTDLRNAITGCDVVFHCAASVGNTVTWESGRRVNVEGTRRIAAAARDAGVRRFVHVSTVGVYGVSAGTYTEDSPRKRVDEPYTDTKIEAEEIVESMLGDRARIVRPAMIYGPRDTGMIPALTRMLAAGAPMIGDGSAPVTLVHVDDVVHAMIAAADYEGPYRVFNVRGLTDLTWAELVSTLVQRFSLRTPRHVPRFVAITMAMIAQALAAMHILKRAPITTFAVDLLTQRRDYTIDRLMGELGVTPSTDVRTALPLALSTLEIPSLVPSRRRSLGASETG